MLGSEFRSLMLLVIPFGLVAKCFSYFPWVVWVMGISVFLWIVFVLYLDNKGLVIIRQWLRAKGFITDIK